MTLGTQLTLISARGKILQEEVTNLYIPASLGQAGILDHHLPYISSLVRGEVSYVDLKGSRKFLYLEKGFIRVSKDRIVIISNSASKGKDINPEQVKGKLQELDNIIEGSLTGKTSPDLLEQALNEKKEWIIKSQILTKMSGQGE